MDRASFINPIFIIPLNRHKFYDLQQDYEVAPPDYQRRLNRHKFYDLQQDYEVAPPDYQRRVWSS
ncbi:unnamed protein product [Gongylonema pulchrum]|uniref:Uncharacterized protein n=1 Tax=Gongylonema pulchrum TaxID=637853 RepID=A0A183DUC5_9BILA|nr:unnamed protein product [Gongylonema pulchrum]